VLDHHGLVAQLAGTVILGLLSYVLYYFFFNRAMFAQARALLKR